MLKLCRIGEERLVPDELQQDLFTQTSTRAGAVLASAGKASRSGLGPLRRGFALIHKAALLLHALAESITAGSRTGFAMATMAVTLAAAVLAVDILAADGAGPPGWAVGAAGLVVFTWLLIVTLRSGAFLAIVLPPGHPR